jgi:adenosylhomocysteine nucleosidase
MNAQRSKGSVWFIRLCVLALLAALLGCRQQQVVQVRTGKVDATPRMMLMAALEDEAAALLKNARVEQVYEIGEHTFTTAVIKDRPVVIVFSGASMVNAAMTAQLAIDQFNVRGMVFTGIAGGVNPQLHIGDVVIPAGWAQHLESLFARKSDSGWNTDWHSRSLGNYGMIFPQPVQVPRPEGRPGEMEEKTWFEADARMLAAAKTAAEAVQLQRCALPGICLAEAPRVIVGGKGVSGPAFIDNAEYRQWLFDTFQADAVDMETAAAAQVAYVNAIPFVGFRSLSDLAGGGAGKNELLIFYKLAADNSAQVVMAFLENFNP